MNFLGKEYQSFASTKQTHWGMYPLDNRWIQRYLYNPLEKMLDCRMINLNDEKFTLTYNRIKTEIYDLMKHEDLDPEDMRDILANLLSEIIILSDDPKKEIMETTNSMRRSINAYLKTR